jgi:hypothetical protein
VLAYRTLLAGRMLVSTLLSAQVDQDSVQAGDATRALQAAGQVLHHFARTFPVALGSSEVLYETCRGSCVSITLTVSSPTLCRKTVCGADIQYPPAPESVARQNVFAWYRPIAFKARWAFAPGQDRSDRQPSESEPATEFAAASAGVTWQNEYVVCLVSRSIIAHASR